MAVSCVYAFTLPSMVDVLNNHNSMMEKYGTLKIWTVEYNKTSYIKLNSDQHSLTSLIDKSAIEFTITHYLLPYNWAQSYWF